MSKGDDTSDSSVFLMIRYKKTTLYLDAKESDTIESLKNQIKGLLDVDIKQQKLFRPNDSLGEELSDSKALANCGITATTALAYRPFELYFTPETAEGLEEMDITPYSQPPELPDVMKPEPTQDN